MNNDEITTAEEIAKLTMDSLPKTREEAEAHVRRVEKCNVAGVYVDVSDLQMCAALARIGIGAAFPSDETVERVARAICAGKFAKGDDRSMAFSWGHDRAHYINLAREALIALAKGAAHD